MRKRLVSFVAIVQSTLFLGHFFLFETWAFRTDPAGSTHAAPTKIIFALLSMSFVTASLLAFRYSAPPVRLFYKASAIWLGMLTFLMAAAFLSWILYGVLHISGHPVNFHLLVEFLYAAAIAVGTFGIFNASLTRVTRTTVRLANLPDAWRGRKAALISDVHLGHVRNRHFLRRMVAKILREKPDTVFIAGDLYDGTAIDAGRAAEPLTKLTAPQGVYFVAGNHEQFGDDSKYLRAVTNAGVRVLSNEKVDVEGLQILGVPYRDATQGGALASLLSDMRLDRDRASILLIHAPDHPEVAEAAGVSLQLSGHTHLGQFVPWSWMARRMYRQFVYGLSRIGQMQVFTSSGAGTWGPPVRLGSNPEIVVLEFE